MNRKTADEWFEEYGESHRNPVNKLIHWVCVPLIYLVVFGLLWELPQPQWLADIPVLNWHTHHPSGHAVLLSPVTCTGKRIRPVYACLPAVSAGLRISVGNSALDQLYRRLCHSLDRTVYRTPHRREKTLLFQRHPVSPDWSRLADGVHIPDI